MSRNVILYSGGLDSTLLLHKLALESKKTKIPTVAIAVSSHTAMRSAQFKRQAKARKNYLAFAKKRGLVIDYQTLEMSGTAKFEKCDWSNDFCETHRKYTVINEWQAFLPWVVPFLQREDKLWFGYNSHHVEERLNRFLEQYTNLRQWSTDKSPKCFSPFMGSEKMRLFVQKHKIPRECVSSCDVSKTLKDCGISYSCGKCDRVRDIFGV